MKKWTLVCQFKDCDIKHLDHAGINDCVDYKISPSLAGEDKTYKTIGVAINAIDQNIAPKDLQQVTK